MRTFHFLNSGEIIQVMRGMFTPFLPVVINCSNYICSLSLVKHDSKNFEKS